MLLGQVVVDRYEPIIGAGHGPVFIPFYATLDRAAQAGPPNLVVGPEFLSVLHQIEVVPQFLHLFHDLSSLLAMA